MKDEISSSNVPWFLLSIKSRIYLVIFVVKCVFYIITASCVLPGVCNKSQRVNQVVRETDWVGIYCNCVIPFVVFSAFASPSGWQQYIHTSVTHMFPLITCLYTACFAVTCCYIQPPVWESQVEPMYRSMSSVIHHQFFNKPLPANQKQVSLWSNVLEMLCYLCLYSAGCCC